ncbi:MAG: hypothetical protein D3920_10870 [Candidatus Electrothrix sp. AW2]|nr:hypothetical protein [Candidatus Electrothrix gigas]
MEHKSMLRNYLTELKNILTKPNPYKTVISPSEGTDDWMEGIYDNQKGKRGRKRGTKKGTDLFSKPIPFSYNFQMLRRSNLSM